jgi:2-pyrone-4,6-dicarboxylate lactonase
MGWFDPTRGVADPAFGTLLDLLADGRIWVKLTAYRMSLPSPDYEAVRPFHDAMVEANPDQLVWGTDWPHVKVDAHMPRDADLLDRCLDWIGDERLAHKILVENPARLYGFPSH